MPKDDNKDGKPIIISKGRIPEQRKRIQAQSDKIAEQANLVARMIGGENIEHLLGEDVAEDVEEDLAPKADSAAKLKAKL